MHPPHPCAPALLPHTASQRTHAEGRAFPTVLPHVGPSLVAHRYSSTSRGWRQSRTVARNPAEQKTCFGTGFTNCCSADNCPWARTLRVTTWESYEVSRTARKVQTQCIETTEHSRLLVATEDSVTLIKSNPEPRHSGPILFSLAMLKWHRPMLKEVKEVLMATEQMHGPSCESSFEHIHPDPSSCKILGILCLQEHPSLCACKKP